MRRGEIWTGADATDYGRKPRPMVIIQDDAFDTTESVVAVPFTASSVDAPLLRIAIPASDDNGLDRPSWLMVDKIGTYRRSRLQARLGELEPDRMIELERALATFLGLAR